MYNENGGRKSRRRASGDDRSRRNRDRRSRRNRHNEDSEEDDGDVQIVLAEPQDPQFHDDSFTVNTYGTRASKKPGKDPTMYVPGQEDKPDPDSDILMLTDGADASGRRYYVEDPPLKPKRDPTMYVQGGHGDYSAEDPPLKAKRDPTMYVDGDMDPSVYGVDGQRDPTMYVDGDQASVEAFSIGGPSSRRGGGDAPPSVSGYNSADPYGMNDIDDSERENQSYGFGGGGGGGEYDMTDEMNAEYVRGRKDPSYYMSEDQSFKTEEPDQSFRTQEPSVGGKKKKKKSKKSGR
jgi:hypothetical protein